MATVSGTFTANGVSLTLPLRKLRQSVLYSVTAPFHGVFQLERARGNPQGAWEIVAGPWSSLSVTPSGNFQAESGDRLRMRAKDMPTNIIENGDFAAATGWTANSGWAIGSGVATGTTASTDLERTCDIPLIEGASYEVTFTMTRTAGSVVVKLGGTSGTSRSSADTFTETIVAGSGQLLEFTGTGFSGTIDDVTIIPVVSYSFNDADEIVKEWKDGNGDALMTLKESGLYLTGDLQVDGNTLPGITETVTQGAKVGATAGWVVGANTDVGLMGTLPASQTDSTLVIPISGLAVGDTITGYGLLGQIESGGGNVTVDAELRKHTAAAADVVDAQVSVMTQVTASGDAILNSSDTLDTPATVAEDETFYLLVTGTTAGSTDVALQGAKVTVTKG